MPTLFTRIIDGEIPGRFVWKDEHCVCFLTINPIQPGHVLVVPRQEVDHWLDLEPALLRHLMEVSHVIGQAIQAGFTPTKVGQMIAGLEVPHVHIHLVPIRQLADMNFENADPDPRSEDLDAAAETIREQLRAAGHGNAVGQTGLDVSS